jgi:hypothetical protein
MTLQLVLVGFIIAAAAAVVVRAVWQAWFGKTGSCGSGCGKCVAGPESKQQGRFPLPQA